MATVPEVLVVQWSVYGLLEPRYVLVHSSILLRTEQL